MGDHRLKCLECGSINPPGALSCSNDHAPALLRAEYATRRLTPRDLPGMWRFLDWLPVASPLRGTGEGAVAYRSEGLAEELGLNNLYIGFAGYWPERRAKMPTCTFKDLEAPPTVQGILERGGRERLVVASAGNTARAFAQVASVADYPLIIVVPESARSRLWLTVEKGPVTAIGVRGDYYDAIKVADVLAKREGYRPEGGAKNVARRDGMGTVVLEAALAMGALPRHYFQAVGSGTGGISAWEAGLRLIADGRFGSVLPRLHLAQNVPNAPLYDLWRGEKAEYRQDESYDDVLFNRSPPYALKGGVKDALEGTGGEIYGITGKDAGEAKRLFEETEEIDILNAPAVAVAALAKAASCGFIGRDDSVLLNITGGGVSRLLEDTAPETIDFDIIVSGADEALEFLEGFDSWTSH